MTYKFVTREDIDTCMRGCDLMSRQLVERLLSERDAYRELAMELSTECDLELQGSVTMDIDAEAARIMEGKS